MRKASPPPESVRPSRFAWDEEESRHLFATPAQKFDPNQPRFPKGHPLGGQWTPSGIPSGSSVEFVDPRGNTVVIQSTTSLFKHLRRQDDGTYKLSPERQALHDRIVASALRGVTPVENPVMNMTGGGPASGKSTMLESGLAATFPTNAVTVNADDVKEQLPDYQRVRAQRAKQAAAYTHDESSMVADRIRDAARVRSLNITYDTTGDSTYDKLAEKVERFRSAGYRVEAHYASLDTDLAVRIAEIRGRNTGRWVPETIVRNTHRQVSVTFADVARRNLFDAVTVYDTNLQGQPRVIARGNRRGFTVVNQPLYDNFLAKGHAPLHTPTRRAAEAVLDTHAMENIVKEILLDIPDSESAYSGRAAEDFRAAIRTDLESIPEGAEVFFGKEMPEATSENLYDAPYGGEEQAAKSEVDWPEEVAIPEVVRIKQINHEKQIAYGEVYAPNVLDTYGEFMTAADIELMAHRFMQLDLRAAIDTQHDNVPNGAYPVESFIAREGDPDYTPGAWVLGVKIPDNSLWRKVKTGELNGFSFQSLVKPATVDISYTVYRDQVGKTEPQDDHDHVYLVELDEIGNVIGGRTSRAADGHFHEITRASHTEKAGDHSHRFFL